MAGREIEQVTGPATGLVIGLVIGPVIARVTVAAQRIAALARPIAPEALIGVVRAATTPSPASVAARLHNETSAAARPATTRWRPTAAAGAIAVALARLHDPVPLRGPLLQRGQAEGVRHAAVAVADAAAGARGTRK
jgi:hypothetical protein